MKKDKIKIIIPYIIVSIMCCGVIWFLFFMPSKKEKESQKLNTELPDGKSKPISDSKKNSYENKPSEKKDLYSMSTLFEARKKKQEERLNKSELRDPTGTGSDSDIFTEADNASNTVNEFHQMQQESKAHQELIDETQKLRAVIDQMELEKREEALKPKVNAQEMLQESYRLAGVPYPGDKTAPVQEKEERVVEETKALSNITISSMGGGSQEDPANAVILHNKGFNTAVGTGVELGRNTIRACVHKEQSLTDGQRILLRLIEPLQAGESNIPAGYVIAGIAHLQKDRLGVDINSIEYEGNIIPVSMAVYDTDGSSGIYCPGSEELDAAKDAAANIGTSVGSNISLTASAGQQIAMDLTRGLISGGTQYLSKKLRIVRVTLKENYEVLLLPKK
jgi:conjugative transposon TraM protein